MNSQSTVLLRSGDVVVALATANEYGKALSKTDVQKFVYLMDVIGYLYNVLPPIDHHRTYRHGPYDVNLQNAIDSLGFRGLVLVRNVGKTSQGIRATYELTKAGLRFGDRLRAHIAFDRKYRIAARVGQNLQEIGWDRLIELVYGEPTFMSAKTFGYGQNLPIYDGLENSAACVFRIIESLIALPSSPSSIGEEYIADVFMYYLEQVSARHPYA